MGQVKNSIERVFDLFFFVDFYLFLGICGYRHFEEYVGVLNWILHVCLSVIAMEEPVDRIHQNMLKCYCSK